MSSLLIAYYADDFTGATDAMERLELAGVPTALFLEPPTPADMTTRSDVRAVGVAGFTRALPPALLDDALRPALTALAKLGAPHVHYKVCSTFDSSPDVGSIGRAIDVGAQIIPAPLVPVVAAAPELGRYVAFGNLFARLGIGSAGEIFRLDRHPAMMRHPVTPADESDLRRHLARQTALPIGLFDLLALDRPDAEQDATLEALIVGGARAVLFDGVTAAHLQTTGRLLDRLAALSRPLFTVGSSGVESALGAHWRATNAAFPRAAWPGPGRAPLLAAAGSCSPVTAAQLAHARAQGFAEICIDVEHDEHEPTCLAKILDALRVGRSVIVHTGGEQPRSQPLPAAHVGARLGRLVRGALAAAPACRVCLAGGDTSSYAARELGIRELRMRAPLTPGAPLCRAVAPGSPADGRELVFKGGQVGAADYFTRLATLG